MRAGNKSIAVCFMFLFIFLCAGSLSGSPAAKTWEIIEKQVRDGKIEKHRAQYRLSKLRPKLGAYYREIKGEAPGKAKWVFPVKGYTIKDADPWYEGSNYDFFDGNEHKGHPAADIFINDKNQDALDDETKRPAKILSVSSGIVVSVNKEWKEGSGIRGGNYIWIYDPGSRGLFYYAHLKQIFVKPGGIVEPGYIIAALGRTGKNAAAKRSPTHLHIMYLRYPKNGCPVPENIYNLFSCD